MQNHAPVQAQSTLPLSIYNCITHPSTGRWLLQFRGIGWGMVQWYVDNPSCFLHFLSGSFRALFFSKVAGELPLAVLRRVYGDVLFDLHADHNSA